MCLDLPCNNKIWNMGLYGSIISGAGQGAAATMGGIFSTLQMRKVKNGIKAAKQRSQQWYDKEYNADFTQRADAQSALTKARNILDAKYKQAQGASAVAGATDESVAQQKSAANNTLAAITSNIAERADAYKEQVRANYENQQAQADNAMMGYNTAQAQNIANAAAAVGESFKSAESMPY
jgi:hypothetical protein